MVDTNNDPFYPGPWDNQDNIRRSALWPLAQVLHYNHGLFITRTGGPARDNVQEMAFSVASGLSVLGAKLVNKEISLHRVDDPMTGRFKDQDFLKSKNYRYIAQKLTDPASQAGEEIRKIIKDAEENFFPRLYSYMIGHYKRMVSAPSAEVTDMTNGAAKLWLFKMALEQVSEEDVPSEALATIKDTWSKILVQQKVIAQYQHQTREFFDREKYVIGWLGAKDSIMMGSVNTSPLIKVATNAAPGSYSINDMRLTPTIPFRLYKDLDSIDPAYRANLMASLAFYKVNREAAKNKFACVDSQGFIPAGNYIWPVVGSMIWTANEQQQWMVLDKIS